MNHSLIEMKFQTNLTIVWGPHIVGSSNSLLGNQPLNGGEVRWQKHARNGDSPARAMFDNERLTI